MKLLKLVHKFLIVAAVLSVGYAVYNPDFLPYPFLQEPLKKTNDVVLGVVDEKVDTKKIGTDVYQGGKKVFEQVAERTDLPKKWLEELPDKPNEIVVEDVVEAMTNEVKQLPQSQAEKVKYQFCKTVLEEATATGEVAGAASTE